MSKRDLKKYLRELPRPALEEQLLDLYVRFPEVKTYYDFIFNPKEDKLVQEAKTKIGNEYFPDKMIGKLPISPLGIIKAPACTEILLPNPLLLVYFYYKFLFVHENEILHLNYEVHP